MASGKYSVAWDFNYIPSEEWKNGVGSALTSYAADQTDANWDAVVTAFVDGWANEAAIAEYFASVENVRALQMTIVAEVATNYYQLRALDRELP